MWLQDTGVLDKIKYDGLNHAIPIPQPKVWKDEPLNLYKLGIIMILFVFGIASSTLVFLFELGKNKIKSGSNKPKSSKGRTGGVSGIELMIEDKMVGGGRNMERRVEQLKVVEEDVALHLKKSGSFQVKSSKVMDEGDRGIELRIGDKMVGGGRNMERRVEQLEVVEEDVLNQKKSGSYQAKSTKVICAGGTGRIENKRTVGEMDEGGENEERGMEQIEVQSIGDIEELSLENYTPK